MYGLFSTPLNFTVFVAISFSPLSSLLALLLTKKTIHKNNGGCKLYGRIFAGRGRRKTLSHKQDGPEVIGRALLFAYRSIFMYD
jgi:hypothetical protein